MFSFLSNKFSGVLKWLSGKTRLTDGNIDEAFNQVSTALLEADVPHTVVSAFLEQIRKDVIGKKVVAQLNPGEQFIKVVYENLLSFLGQGAGADSFAPPIPSVIMVMGLQGSGKTTTVGKLAYRLKSQALKKGKNRRILLASIDFARPAAVEQLRVLAQSIEVDSYQAQGTNALMAVKEIYEYFKKNSYEYLFLDTAGRLQVDEPLMEELKAVASWLKPQYSVLVLDAMTGQESLKVAQTFNSRIGFDGAILTKMDSDARGGAAFAFRYEIKKPILFVGSGEKMDDLESFVPDGMARRILGMGDIQSLLERAQDRIEDSAQTSLMERFKSGSFTLEDFAQQLDMVNKLGSFQKILQYLPGASSVSPEMVEQSQVQMKQFRALISSMTPKERAFPEILNGSRKQRVARGAGSSVQTVNQLLEKFEQSKQFVKMMKKSGLHKHLWK